MRQPATRREREIWEACDKLLPETREVKQITGQKIMHKLLELGYKKGCPNEIYKYRRSWWETRDIDLNVARGIVIPDNSNTANSPLQRAVELVQEELNLSAKKKIDDLTLNHDLELSKLQLTLESERKVHADILTVHAELQARCKLQRTHLCKLNAAKVKLSTRCKLLETQTKQQRVTQLKTTKQHKLSLWTLRKDSLAVIHKIEHTANAKVQLAEEKAAEILTIAEKTRQQYLVEQDKSKQKNKEIEIKYKDKLELASSLQVQVDSLLAANLELKSQLEASASKQLQTEQQLVHLTAKYNSLCLATKKYLHKYLCMLRKMMSKTKFRRTVKLAKQLVPS